MSYVLSPDVAYGPYVMSVPADSKVSPSPLFWPWLRGDKLLPEIVVALVHGVPGVTTIDDEFPDNLKPQFRTNSRFPQTTIYVVMYHGSPGVKQGDDNWDPLDASPVPALTEDGDFLTTEAGDVFEFGPLNTYRPQMRLNTAPHTTDPTIVAGRWRYNEAFLAP